VTKNGGENVAKRGKTGLKRGKGGENVENAEKRGERGRRWILFTLVGLYIYECIFSKYAV